MKKYTMILLMLAVVGLHADDEAVASAAAAEDTTTAEVEAPLSEAFKAIQAGLIAKPGSVSDLTEVKEDALQKIENLAAQGQNVQDALDYLDSRIGFDPQKKDANAQRLQTARDRIAKAAASSAATTSAKTS